KLAILAHHKHSGLRALRNGLVVGQGAELASGWEWSLEPIRLHRLLVARRSDEPTPAALGKATCRGSSYPVPRRWRTWARSTCGTCAGAPGMNLLLAFPASGWQSRRVPVLADPGCSLVA